MTRSDPEDQYPADEAAQRAEALARAVLKAPPMPLKNMQRKRDMRKRKAGKAAKLRE